jgi:putative addiction module component (TIGR02574 family)
MLGTKEIVKEAESLPVEERAFVVDSLLRTLNPPRQAIDKEWAAVAKQRLEEFRSGRVEAIPGEKVFSRVKERFAK